MKGNCERALKFFDNWYPFIFPIPVVFGACWLKNICGVNYNNLDFNNVLNGVITFCSIGIGFTGTMLAILATIKDSEFLTQISSNNFNKSIKNFTIATILSGVIVVGLSCLLYLESNHMIKYIWAVFLVLFGLCEYRIVTILLKILFLNPHDDMAKSNRMKEKEKQELRESNTPK